ncbi:MAG: DUF1552 domain-containing protein [Myxococcales bacterium]|nr:DUF1552 domain-containing protein [Myxococcales bacterium]MCB9530890.1 DUF1552 domain-containing protein [Myxococcales bacterium]
MTGARRSSQAAAPRLSRRRLLQSFAGAALALPFVEFAAGRPAAAMDGVARRLVVFYFPDGVAGRSANGEPSLWHCTGSGSRFELGESLRGLSRHAGSCVFFNGVSMGPTDSGSHPGGAKKLLTGADGGAGESIDQHLARSVGADRPFRHLYLGAMANYAGASGDKHISYPSAGVTIAPEDNPALAFERLFDGRGAAEDPGDDAAARRTRSVLDTAMADLADLRGSLDARDRARLDDHLDALREVEARIATDVGGPVGSCDDPALDTHGYDPAALYDPAQFPALLAAQTDLAVQAMACGLTSVAVIQASQHTSELVMSRFAGTEMYDPGYDMRSHQASHYGASHDRSHREFADYLAQRAWWVDRFAALLDALAARPEGDGTMLDHTVALLCSEVSDGNTHSHDDMPFVVAGAGGGAIRTGQLIDHGGGRHSDLLLSIARAMGSPIDSFGWDCSGPIPGLLS